MRAVQSGQTRGGGRKAVLTTAEKEELRHSYEVLRPRMKQLWAYLEEGARVTPSDFQSVFISIGLDPSLAESLLHTKPTSFAPRRWVLAALADYYGISAATVERYLQTDRGPSTRDRQNEG